MRRARAEREARRLFVKDKPVTVHTKPDEAGKELGQVPRWGELVATGRTRGRWYEIEWTSPSLETALQSGWVLGGFLERGSVRLPAFSIARPMRSRADATTKSLEASLTLLRPILFQ